MLYKSWRCIIRYMVNVKREMGSGRHAALFERINKSRGRKKKFTVRRIRTGQVDFFKKPLFSFNLDI